MRTVKSGNGWRTTIEDASGPAVSFWATSEKDAEYQSGREHMRLMEREEAEEARLQREFAEQQVREFAGIRARA